MSVLRFPNPGSDIAKFISTYTTIYKELNGTKNFTHDDARDALIKHGLVSSSGAIGIEATRRSQREDRSRDPLYNQLKMYSELYRMLGWYKPGTMNTNFNFTELSSYIAKATPKLQKRLFEECLLSIVFPNPLVENKKGNTIRPFTYIVKLAASLDVVIFRDEIIIAVLALQNDTEKDTFQQSIQYIRDIRRDFKKLQKEKEKLSKNTKIQENTLENYTRFPLGSLKFTEWFESGTVRGIYTPAQRGYQLTDLGKEKANQLALLRDVRHEEIENFNIETRGAFTLLSSFAFFERCGYDISGIEKMLMNLMKKSSPILKHLGISKRSEIFYSPFQQALQEEIDYANKLDSEYQQ